MTRHNQVPPSKMPPLPPRRTYSTDEAQTWADAGKGCMLVGVVAVALVVAVVWLIALLGGPAA